MSKKKTPKIILTTSIAAIAALLGIQSAQAATMYWDSNGSTIGSGVTPTGTWGTDAFWTSSSSGVLATANTTTTTADDLYFSTGNDAVGAYTVTLNGLQNARSVTARTGNLTLSSGTLALANEATSGTSYLLTSGAANLTVGSTLLVDNSTAGNNFLNFAPVVGTTITINGPVLATNNAAANKIYIRQTGAGAVVINTNLGSDAGFLAGLQAGGMDGATGTLTLNGAQSLGTVGIGITSRTGIVDLGDTVNTGNAVTLGSLGINSATNNLAGATINVNSAVTVGSGGINVRNGGTINVGGALTTTGATFLGVGSTGNTYHGGAMKILNSATATLAAVQVGDSLVFTDAGTLTCSSLTLGEATGNTSGKFVLGDATGVGLATVGIGNTTALATAGTSTSSAIVGGNSAVSTLTVDGGGSFAGTLGGTGANENNLALVKSGGGTTLILSNVNTFVGSTTINGGTLNLSNQNAVENSTVTLTGVGALVFDTSVSGHAFTFGGLAASSAGTGYNISLQDNAGTPNAVALTVGNNNSNTTYAGVLSSTGSLIKTGTGTLTLTGSNTYTGATTVNAGTLLINGSIAASTSTVNSSATLAGSGTTGAVTVSAGGTLAGTLHTGALTVQLNGVLSPGSNLGTLTSASAAFQSGGKYTLQMNNDGGTGSAGTNWDKVAISGALDLSGLSSSNKFVLTLQTLDGTNASGLLGTFDQSLNHTWASIIATGGLSLPGGGFNSNLFNVDTSGFQNSFAGTFSVIQDSLNSNNLDLLYTAVPEPSTWMMLAGGLGMVMMLQQARRRTA